MNDTGLNVPCPMCGNNHGSHTWMCPWHPDNKKQAKVSTDLSEENKSLRDQLAKMTQERDELRAELHICQIEYGDVHDSYTHYKAELATAREESKISNAIAYMIQEDAAKLREEIATLTSAFASCDRARQTAEEENERLKKENTGLLEELFDKNTVQLMDELKMYATENFRLKATIKDLHQG